MQSSLLAMRLRMQVATGAPLEPILRTGNACVVAFWPCSCAAAGLNFDDMTVIPCRHHHLALTGRSFPKVRILPAPAAELERTVFQSA